VLIATLLISHSVRSLATSYDGPASSLGAAGHDLLYVTPVFDPSDSDAYDLKLRFECRRNKRVASSTEFKVGPSFGMPTAFSVFPYLRNARSQVFVSVRYGAVSSFLLDYDGKKIKVIYKRTEGRVEVIPGIGSSGRAFLLETWTQRQYADEFPKPGHVYKAGPLVGKVRRVVYLPNS